MELLLVKTVTALLLPPGLFVLLSGGALLLRPPRRIVLAMIGVAVLIWGLSTSLVADRLLQGLDRFPYPAASDLANAEAVVVLSGDRHVALAPDGREEVGPYTRERVAIGARIVHETGLPVLVAGGVVFGGGTPAADLMAQTLEQAGVAVRWVERVSRTTQENAALSAPLLRQAGVRKVALVTHYWHLPRAVNAFRAQGFEVIPVPGTAPLRGIRRPVDTEALLPSATALAQSAAALHEHLGMLWYRLRYGIHGNGSQGASG